MKDNCTNCGDDVALVKGRTTFRRWKHSERRIGATRYTDKCISCKCNQPEGRNPNNMKFATLWAMTFKHVQGASKK